MQRAVEEWLKMVTDQQKASSLSRTMHENRSFAEKKQVSTRFLPCYCEYLQPKKRVDGTRNVRESSFVIVHWLVLNRVKKVGNRRGFRTTIGRIKKLFRRGQSGPVWADWKNTIPGEMVA